MPVYLVGPGAGVALLHAGWRGTAGGILPAGVERLLARSLAPLPSDIVMHCGVGICGACYEVGSEVHDGLRRAGRRSRALASRSPRHLAATAEDLRLGSRSRFPAGARAHDRQSFYSHRASRGTDGRMVAYLGLPRSRLTPPPDRGNICVLSRRAPGRANCAMWGSSPTFFFLQPRCLSTRCSHRFATTSPASGSSWSTCGVSGRWSAPSCRCGWTARTADPARASRPTTVRGSAGPSSASWNPARWSGRGTCWRCPRPGIERPLRWPEHWRRFVGRRARVRSRALGGGRREVEIVAVPDDEHVTLRPEGGGEITVALDDIREATLVVEFAPPKPGSKRTRPGAVAAAVEERPQGPSLRSG